MCRRNGESGTGNAQSDAGDGRGESTETTEERGESTETTGKRSDDRVAGGPSLDRRSVLRTAAVAGTGATLAAGATPAAAGDIQCGTADRFVQSPNYSPRQEEINWLVIHVTAGSYAGAVSWFQNPDSNVGIHYIVSNYDDTAYDPGHVTQMVHHENAAWHARSIANHRAIGIELEWMDGHDPEEPISDACYEALADIAQCVTDQYDIPHEFYEDETCIQNEPGGIIGHTHVPDGDCSNYDHGGRTCPYPDFDPGTFMSYLDDGGDGGDDPAFEDGDAVVTTASVNGREQPGLDSDVVAVLDPGTEAEVVNGPVEADGYTWWGLHVPAESIWVWVVEAYLDPMTEPSPPSVGVETDPPSAVGETSATLGGTVTTLEGVEEATVFFEYGPAGAGFPEATDPVTVGAGATASVEVSGLDSATGYEYRAVASAGEAADEGAVQSFETDEESGGCFLTTATADDAGTLDALRRYRDESMAATPVGRGLVGLYYRISPPIAATLARHPRGRTASAVRWLVGRCAGLSGRQAETTSRVQSALLGAVIAALYVVGLLVAAVGHAAIRGIEASN
jgi:hypothetical protein